MTLMVISHSAEFSMMIEVLLYPALAVMAVLFLYITLGPREEVIRSVTHDLAINIDKCASEHCVRCTKYKSVIKKASDKYKSSTDLRERAGERLDAALTSLCEDRSYEGGQLQQPNILYVEDLLAQPVWPDSHFFSDVTILESKTDDILTEFEAVYNNAWPEGWLVNNTPDGEWAVFHLINQGAPVKKNCLQCPKTVKVLETLISSMKENVFANASFSVVQPGTNISPHYGPTNIRIRCHLGLRVPNITTSSMTVSSQRLTWTAGKCVFFDDSFLHEVSHDDADGDARAVLLIDFWHPALTEQEKEIVDNLFKFQKVEMASAARAIPVHIETEL